jgi:hypothetical protein
MVIYGAVVNLCLSGGRWRLGWGKRYWQCRGSSASKVTMDIQQNFERVTSPDPGKVVRSWYCKRSFDFARRILEWILFDYEISSRARNWKHQGIDSQAKTGKVSTHISLDIVRSEGSTNFVKILVSEQCKPELRAATNYSRRTSLIKGFETFLSIYFQTL